MGRTEVITVNDPMFEAVGRMLESMLVQCSSGERTDPGARQKALRQVLDCRRDILLDDAAERRLVHDPGSTRPVSFSRQFYGRDAARMDAAGGPDAYQQMEKIALSNGLDIQDPRMFDHLKWRLHKEYPQFRPTLASATTLSQACDAITFSEPALAQEAVIRLVADARPDLLEQERTYSVRLSAEADKAALDDSAAAFRRLMVRATGWARDCGLPVATRDERLAALTEYARSYPREIPEQFSALLPRGGAKYRGDQIIRTTATEPQPTKLAKKLELDPIAISCGRVMEYLIAWQGRDRLNLDDRQRTLEQALHLRDEGGALDAILSPEQALLLVQYPDLTAPYAPEKLSADVGAWLGQHFTKGG